MDSDIEGRVRAFWEQAFNARDLDLIDAITAPEFVNRNALPGTPRGPEGHRLVVERLWQAFPDAHFPREVVLTGDEVTIGRRSESKGYNPDIDLSSPDDDPAVSRRHAVLRRLPDGSWAVVDVGSTNGTWLNDDDEPLPQGELRPVLDGDRVLLGAFTCITIRSNAPAAG